MHILGLLESYRWLKKEGDIFSLLLIVYHASVTFLAGKYYIPKMGVDVLRGSCPTNRGSYPIEIIVLRGRCP